MNSAIIVLAGLAAPAVDLSGAVSQHLGNQKRLSTVVSAPTICTRFSQDLDLLMRELKLSTVHFVRCVKPNNALTPNAPVASVLLDQLLFSGMLEAVQVRDAPMSMSMSMPMLPYCHATMSMSMSICKLHAVRWLWATGLPRAIQPLAPLVCKPTAVFSRVMFSIHLCVPPPPAGDALVIPGPHPNCRCAAKVQCHDGFSTAWSYHEDGHQDFCTRCGVCPWHS